MELLGQYSTVDSLIEHCLERLDKQGFNFEFSERISGHVVEPYLPGGEAAERYLEQSEFIQTPSLFVVPLFDNEPISSADGASSSLLSYVLENNLRRQVLGSMFYGFAWLLAAAKAYKKEIGSGTEKERLLALYLSFASKDIDYHELLIWVKNEDLKRKNKLGKKRTPESEDERIRQAIGKYKVDFPNISKEARWKNVAKEQGVTVWAVRSRDTVRGQVGRTPKKKAQELRNN